MMPGGTGSRAGAPGAEGPLEPGQVAERDVGGCPAGALGRNEPAEQRGHRRALVGEDPDIALRAGELERLGESRDRACFISGGCQRQRPQRARLDEAVAPALGDRRGVQPVQ